MEQLLALGAVVRVRTGKERTIRAVIAGYYPQDGSSGRIFDYIAVPYPLGMQFGPTVKMFNEKSIVEVVSPGYLTAEAETFTKTLPGMMQRYVSGLVEIIRDAQAAQKQDGAPGDGPAKPADPLADFG